MLFLEPRWRIDDEKRPSSRLLWLTIGVSSATSGSELRDKSMRHATCQIAGDHRRCFERRADGAPPASLPAALPTWRPPLDRQRDTGGPILERGDVDDTHLPAPCVPTLDGVHWESSSTLLSGQDSESPQWKSRKQYMRAEEKEASPCV
ncbi:MAG: hypothetical protein ABGZ35_13720, partial [Planctomycetaceae bacterium]